MANYGVFCIQICTYIHIDRSQRRRYMEWVLEQQAVDTNFLNKILFSDKAHFTLGSYANKPNCRIQDSENSQVIEERPLPPESLFGVLFGPKGVIEPYFFENNDGTTVTINSKRYGHMITNLFWHAIEE